VQALLDAGVAAVIATDHDVDDAVAARFAARFYEQLAEGATIQSAFDDAAAAVRLAFGGQLRSVQVHPCRSAGGYSGSCSPWCAVDAACPQR